MVNTTFQLVMGDRGRLVVPAELRNRWGLEAGSTLLLVETPEALVLATREQVKRLVRRQLDGRSLVEELISDRRAAAEADARA
ncbi:MAG TPA: AbrB/MazE/SpoVT family DNA-binding domain-containing protein [Lapillicoccus sp.]|jgi:AbrB family looped-hinge helix DNA binding protein|nr:AbrB/MazE/SpoVT family DNA-binding domain-containing protein [Lapillicoccus sp.]